MKIRQSVVNDIIVQAKNEFPNESCGYLLGNNGIIEQNYKMTNNDHSPEHFSFIPQEQFAASRFARQHNLQIIANWHSHPSSPARPSQEDIKLAYDATIIYFIISLASEPPVINAFKIVNGVVDKLNIEII